MLISIHKYNLNPTVLHSFHLATSFCVNTILPKYNFKCTLSRVYTTMFKQWQCLAVIPLEGNGVGGGGGGGVPEPCWLFNVRLNKKCLCTPPPPTCLPSPYEGVQVLRLLLTLEVMSNSPVVSQANTRQFGRRI